jgi:hypothetical protein
VGEIRGFTASCEVSLHRVLVRSCLTRVGRDVCESELGLRFVTSELCCEVSESTGVCEVLSFEGSGDTGEVRASWKSFGMSGVQFQGHIADGTYISVTAAVQWCRCFG